MPACGLLKGCDKQQSPPASTVATMHTVNSSKPLIPLQSSETHYAAPVPRTCWSYSFEVQMHCSAVQCMGCSNCHGVKMAIGNADIANIPEVGSAGASSCDVRRMSACLLVHTPSPYSRRDISPHLRAGIRATLPATNIPKKNKNHGSW